MFESSTKKAHQSTLIYALVNKLIINNWSKEAHQSAYNVYWALESVKKERENKNYFLPQTEPVQSRKSNKEGNFSPIGILGF